MPQPILAQPPTPVARGSVGRASGLAPRKRPWPVPQILGTVAKATPARPQVPIVSQAVQIQPANIGIPASRWKTQAQEWLLGEAFEMICLRFVSGRFL